MGNWATSVRFAIRAGWMRRFLEVPYMLWMDQGLSYWTVSRQQARTSAIVFSMGDDPTALGERLAEIKIGVEGHGLPTQIFLGSRAQ